VCQFNLILFFVLSSFFYLQLSSFISYFCCPASTFSPVGLIYSLPFTWFYHSFYLLCVSLSFFYFLSVSHVSHFLVSHAIPSSYLSLFSNSYSFFLLFFIFVIRHPFLTDNLDLHSLCLTYPSSPYCSILYCTVLYCTVLYCTVLYCTVLYCTVLYCT
jgi:hypothetical protein